MRAGDLLRQISSPRKPRLEGFYEGCYLIFWGVFQKFFVADNLAVIADKVFNSSPPYNGGAVLWQSMPLPSRYIATLRDIPILPGALVNVWGLILWSISICPISLQTPRISGVGGISLYRTGCVITCTILLLLA